MDVLERGLGVAPAGNMSMDFQSSRATETGNSVNRQSLQFDQSPAKRCLSKIEMDFIRFERSRRDLEWRVRMFRRHGNADWLRYLTLSTLQKRTAFKVQSIFLCMFDVYHAYSDLDEEEGLFWFADVENFHECFKMALSTWNPEFGEHDPENFEISVHMRSNSDRCLQVVNSAYIDFLEYISERFDMSKVWNSLEIACTLGSWGNFDP